LAEVAWQQIGVFVELGRRRDEADRRGNVVDCRASSLEAGAGILADLLDLRPHIAFPHDVASLVTRDLAADHQQTLPVAQCDRICRRMGSAGRSNDDRLRKIRNDLPVRVGSLNVFLRLFASFL
jgi:hypothetical protein